MYRSLSNFKGNFGIFLLLSLLTPLWPLLDLISISMIQPVYDNLICVLRCHFSLPPIGRELPRIEFDNESTIDPYFHEPIELLVRGDGDHLWRRALCTVHQCYVFCVSIYLGLSAEGGFLWRSLEEDERTIGVENNKFQTMFHSSRRWRSPFNPKRSTSL